MGVWLGALLLLQPVPGDLSFRSQDPLLVPRATRVLQSAQAASPQPGSGIPLLRKRPQNRCWMGHSVLGYPSCCLSWHSAAAHPGCSRLPGFATCPSHHPGSLSGWEPGMLLPAPRGMLGWHNHHPCTGRDPTARWGGCAGLCPPPPVVWCLSFDLGRGHHGARSQVMARLSELKEKQHWGGFPLLWTPLFHLKSGFSYFLLSWRARHSRLALQGFAPIGNIPLLPRGRAIALSDGVLG